MILKWLTLLIATAALIFSIVACVAINRLTSEVEEVEAAMYANVDEAMRSVADSFKLNRLDYSLQWRTKNGGISMIGVFR